MCLLLLLAFARPIRMTSRSGKLCLQLHLSIITGRQIKATVFLMLGQYVKGKLSAHLVFFVEHNLINVIIVRWKHQVRMIGAADSNSSWRDVLLSDGM